MYMIIMHIYLRVRKACLRSSFIRRCTSDERSQSQPEDYLQSSNVRWTRLAKLHKIFTLQHESSGNYNTTYWVISLLVTCILLRSYFSLYLYLTPIYRYFSVGILHFLLLIRIFPRLPIRIGRLKLQYFTFSYHQYYRTTCTYII